MRWPTKSKRPLRRATFGHAAYTDAWIHAYRLSLRARELGEIDWLLHRRKASPFSKVSPADLAYERGFAAEREATPAPPWPPLPDLPRARREPTTHETTKGVPEPADPDI